MAQKQSGFYSAAETWLHFLAIMGIQKSKQLSVCVQGHISARP